MGLFKCLLIFNVICICTAGWKRTPIDLETKFKQRCKAFGQLQRTAIIYEDNTFNDANCGIFWQLFRAASANNDPCTVTPSNYAPFIRRANSYLRKDPKTNKPLDTIFRDKVCPLYTDVIGN